MGYIHRFDLNRFIKEYKTEVFFETGTFYGDAVEYALKFDFKNLYSSEIVPQLAETASKRFLHTNKVQIINSDSSTSLKQYLPNIKGNILFWLDAHFPGADAQLTEYDMELNEQLRLPLEEELNIISTLRKGKKDVIIIDDLRIYEDGPFENGLVPQDAMPVGERSIKFITDLFSNTHKVFKSYRDEGYTLIFPKRRYALSHFSLKDFLQRTAMVEDHYIM
jgi:hypothetical protein